MAFFSQMGGGMGGMGGMGGSPSAFTSPGIDPMTLALLLRMQSGGMGGVGGGMMNAAPQLPPPVSPGGAGMPPQMAGAPPGAAGPQPQGGMMQLIQQLGALDPAKLKSIFGMLGLGGGGMGGGGLPSGLPMMPGAGTGGLY